MVSLQDVINGIGGIQVLFPLLEQVNKGPVPDQDTHPLVDVAGDGNQTRDQSPDQDDWVVIPSSSYSGNKRRFYRS
jgi:hypothetical protein